MGPSIRPGSAGLLIRRIGPPLALLALYGIVSLVLAHSLGALYGRLIPPLLSKSGKSQLSMLEGIHSAFPPIFRDLENPGLPSWETLRKSAERWGHSGFILVWDTSGRPVRWMGVPRNVAFFEGERAVFTPEGVLLAAGRRFPWGRALIAAALPDPGPSRWIARFDYYPPDVLPPFPDPRLHYLLFKPSGPPLLGIGLEGLNQADFHRLLQGWLNFILAVGGFCLLVKRGYPRAFIVAVGRLLLLLVPWTSLGLPSAWTDPTEFSIHALGPLGNSPLSLLLTCFAVTAIVLHLRRRPLKTRLWLGTFGIGAMAHLWACDRILGNCRLESVPVPVMLGIAALAAALVALGWKFRPDHEPPGRFLPWMSIGLLAPALYPHLSALPFLALGSAGLLTWRREPFFRVFLFACWGLLAPHLLWTGQAQRYMADHYAEMKINQPILEVVELTHSLPRVLQNFDWEAQIPFFSLLEDRGALADYLAEGLNLDVLNMDYRLEVGREGRFFSVVQTRPFKECSVPEREGIFPAGNEVMHARFPLLAGGVPWGFVIIHFSPRSPVLSGAEPLPIQTGIYDGQGRLLEAGSVFLPPNLAPDSLKKMDGIVSLYQEGSRTLLFYFPAWEHSFPYLLFAALLLAGILLSLPFPFRPRSFLFLTVVPFILVLGLTLLLALALTARQSRELIRIVDQWNGSVQQSLVSQGQRISPTLTYTDGLLSAGAQIRAAFRYCPADIMARLPLTLPRIYSLEGDSYLFFMDTDGRVSALLQPTLPDLKGPLAWQAARTWGLLLTLLSFSLMGLLLLAKRFAEPVQVMAAAARRIQKGELFNPQVSLASEELQELGEALKTSITRLQSEDRTLKEILAALPAGVALYSGTECLFRNAPMEALDLGENQVAGLPGSGTQTRGGRLMQFQKVALPAGRWLFIAQDITAEVSAQKLQAFADIARIVAHEVKNPLTPIRLSLDYLKELREKDAQKFLAEAPAVMREILESVEDLEKAALEFSDFARLPVLHKENVDLNGFIEGWLGPFIAAGRLDFIRREEPVSADVDPRLFKRALFNLLNNAWQSASPPPAVHVELRVEASIEIHVSDEGPGLPPEARSRLFEPYFTTKTSGTGLGLLIARRIAEEHGGTLTLLADDGPGLHFVLTLPRAAGAAS